MAAEKFIPRAPHGGENGSDKEAIPNAESGISFESVGDLKKNLVPWMRRWRLEKIVVYAYEGGTERQVGHFVVSDSAGRTTMEDNEGVTVSLFGMPRPPAGRSRSGFRPRGQTMPIEQWLKNKRCSSYSATFDIFRYEEGDEAETMGEAEIATETEFPASAEVPAIETEALPEFVVEKKIKGPRRPRRKKPTRAEVKARRVERTDSEYERVLEAFVKRSEALSKNRRDLSPEDLEGIRNGFRGVSRFLASNRELRRRFINDMLTRHELQPAYLALSMVHISEDKRGEVLKMFPKLTRYQRGITDSSGYSPMQEKGDFKNMMSILDDLFKQSHLKDTYRTAEADNVISTTDRTLADYYHLLYPDKESFIDFIVDIAERDKETWLEIGPGNTYKQPDSLLNTIGDINDDITLIGTDLLYTGESASAIDRFKGWHNLDKEWTAKLNLVGAAAQMLPYKDRSFDQVLSSWVFDKFNRSTDGEYQAYREVARVLKPGGKARIFPVDEATLESPFLRRYFTIEKKSQVPIGEERILMWCAVMIRKEDTSEERKQLREEVDAWTQRFGSNQ